VSYTWWFLDCSYIALYSKEDTIAATANPVNIAPPETEPSPSEFQVGRVLALGIGHAAHDVFSSFLAPLLPLFITNLSLSKTGAGLLTTFLQGPSLLQPLIGHLADRVDLRYLAIPAPLVTAVLMSVLGFAPNYTLLALLLVIAGLSSAGLHAVGPAFAGRMSGSKSLGRGMSLWMLGGEVGYALGPLLVVTAVKWWGLRGVPWLICIGMLGSLLLWYLFRDIRVCPPTPAVSDLSLWQALYQMRGMLLPLLGLVATRAFLLSALGSFLPTYLNEAGISFWMAGASLTVYQGSASFGVLLGGMASDRFGRRVVILVSMLVTPLLFLAFLHTTGGIQLLMLLLIGLVVVMFDPVILALVQENYADNRALASSVYMALMFVVRSIAVLLMGAWGDWRGLHWAFHVSAWVFLLGIPLVLLLPKSSHHA
jgi:FSR family fosmidomycin resistance protein-like MFS transporter